MYDPCQVFRSSVEFHRHYTFRNQLGCSRAYDVYAEYFIGVFIGQHFHQAGGITHGKPTTGGRKWERPAAVCNAFFFELLLCFTHPCDFRIGIDHPGHGIKVDVCGFTRNQLSDCDTFFRGLVGQHWSTYAIADSPDAGNRCL